MTGARKAGVIIACAILLSLSGLAIAAAATSDWARIRSDQIVIFVGDCGYSRLAWKGVEDAPPAISQRFVPAPVTSDETLENKLCATAFERMKGLAGRLRSLFPRARCQAFAREARAFHRRSFAMFPAYALGSFAIPMPAEDVVFEKLGLQRMRREDGTTTFAVWTGSKLSEATRRAFDEAAIFVPIGY